MSTEYSSSSSSDQLASSVSSEALSQTKTIPGSFNTSDAVVSKVQTIILIGLRGVGKSTLALMASAALKFKYVDVEKCVQQHTGIPEAKYFEKVTVDEYKQLQFQLILKALKDNEHNNSIFVFPSTSIDNAYVLEYLVEQNYPYIVNIECDEMRILNYISYNGSPENGIKLVQSAFMKYRSISKYNFFNLFAELDFIKQNLVSVGGDSDIHNSSHLILKPIEKEFVRFLKFITKGANSASAYACRLHLTQGFQYRFTSCLQIDFPNSLDIFPGVEKLIYGADTIEVRIDLIELIKSNIINLNLKIDEFVAKLRRYTYCSMPIILSVANNLSDLNLFIVEYSISSGNEFNSIKNDLRNFYFGVLDCAIKLGTEFLIIDLAICFQHENNFIMNDKDSILSILKQIIHLSGNTGIIGSLHSEKRDFWESSEGAIQIAQLASRLSIKYVRLSSHANSITDNFKIFDFINKTKTEFPDMHVSAFNRGQLGKISKILNKFLTPVDFVAKETINQENQVTDINNKVTAYELQNALHVSFMTIPLNFYIMGANVSKSLSPNIHNQCYKELGLPHEFKLLECTSLVPHLKELVASPNFGGTAVIMPFKLEALKFVTTTSSHVKIIGALNSIIADRSAEEPNKIIRIRGENTDWLGVRLTLSDNISPINAVSKNKTALVIGAGGMSRAAIYALLQLGFQRILLYNRTNKKGKALAEYYNSLSPIKPSSALTMGEFDVNVDDLIYFKISLLSDEEFLTATIPQDFSYPTVIISCIPSTDFTTGSPTHLDLPSPWFNSPSGGVVLETGYDPLMTPLLRKTEQFSHKGWVAVNGLNYLYAQALAQFEMFTGKPAPRALMKSIVLNHYLSNKKLTEESSKSHQVE